MYRNGIDCYRLSRSESRAIHAASKELAAVADPRDKDFYPDRAVVASALPQGLAEFLDHFIRAENSPACVVCGLPVDEAEIGPTPAGWREIGAQRPTSIVEASLGACGSALGRPFTWETLQAGRVIQDISPVRGEEIAQSGHGSSAVLELHSEDGFHGERCDYLLLLGMRNRARVATHLAAISDVRLDSSDRATLAQRRYYILPDDEHIKQLGRDDPDHPELRKMLRMREDPIPVSVLSGPSEDPYVRLDFPFMRCADKNERTRSSLAALMEELTRVRREVVIDPGSLLVIDNYRAVHGRAPFEGRFDGADRWLKRMLVRRTRPRRNG